MASYATLYTSVPLQARLTLAALSDLWALDDCPAILSFAYKLTQQLVPATIDQPPSVNLACCITGTVLLIINMFERKLRYLTAADNDHTALQRLLALLIECLINVRANFRFSLATIFARTRIPTNLACVCRGATCVAFRKPGVRPGSFATFTHRLLGLFSRSVKLVEAVDLLCFGSVQDDL